MAFELDGEEYLRIDPKEHGGSFYEWGEFQKDMPGTDNPWVSGTNMAPFDSEMYLIMNLAVGGATDYWSDNFDYAHPKPWRTDSQTAPKDFWQG